MQTAFDAQGAEPLCVHRRGSGNRMARLLRGQSGRTRDSSLRERPLNLLKDWPAPPSNPACSASMQSAACGRGRQSASAPRSAKGRGAQLGRGDWIPLSCDGNPTGVTTMAALRPQGVRHSSRSDNFAPGGQTLRGYAGFVPIRVSQDNGSPWPPCPVALGFD